MVRLFISFFKAASALLKEDEFKVCTAPKCNGWITSPVQTDDREFGQTGFSSWRYQVNS